MIINFKVYKEKMGLYRGNNRDTNHPLHQLITSINAKFGIVTSSHFRHILLSRKLHHLIQNEGLDNLRNPLIRRFGNLCSYHRSQLYSFSIATQQARPTTSLLRLSRQIRLPKCGPHHPGLGQLCQQCKHLSQQRRNYYHSNTTRCSKRSRLRQ